MANDKKTEMFKPITAAEARERAKKARELRDEAMVRIVREMIDRLLQHCYYVINEASASGADMVDIEVPSEYARHIRRNEIVGAVIVALQTNGYSIAVAPAQVLSVSWHAVVSADVTSTDPVVRKRSK